jgi:pimeloyl-ACP methyl ester carboxylesterase
VIRAFEIEWPSADCTDLRKRLRNVRWPAGSPWDGNEDGLSGDFLRQLVTYWHGGYDWPAVQRSLNELPHVQISLDGLRIHAVVAPGREPHSFPLLMNHGWPSTFAEFAGIVGPLTDPRAYGADPADSFDVVIPSLPGFGFSDPLPYGAARQVTALWVRLMEVLGYDRFGAHGGDIGAFITNRLALEYPDRLIGIHTGFPAEPAAAGYLDEEERRFVDQRIDDRETGGAYAHIQRTRPLTLAYGLSDSPVGLAAWILDKWRDWTDCDGDLRTASRSTTCSPS